MAFSTQNELQVRKLLPLRERACKPILGAVRMPVTKQVSTGTNSWMQ